MTTSQEAAKKLVDSLNKEFASGGDGSKTADLALKIGGEETKKIKKSSKGFKKKKSKSQPVKPLPAETDSEIVKKQDFIIRQVDDKVLADRVASGTAKYSDLQRIRITQSIQQRQQAEQQTIMRDNIRDYIDRKGINPDRADRLIRSQIALTNLNLPKGYVVDMDVDEIKQASTNFLNRYRSADQINKNIQKARDDGVIFDFGLGKNSSLNNLTPEPMSPAVNMSPAPSLQERFDKQVVSNTQRNLNRLKDNPTAFVVSRFNDIRGKPDSFDSTKDFLENNKITRYIDERVETRQEIADRIVTGRATKSDIARSLFDPTVGSAAVALDVATRGGSSRFLGELTKDPLKDPVGTAALVGSGRAVGAGVGVVTNTARPFIQSVKSVGPATASAVKGIGIGSRVGLLGGVGVLAAQDVIQSPDPVKRAAEVTKDFVAFGAGFRSGFSGVKGATVGDVSRGFTNEFKIIGKKGAVKNPNVRARQQRQGKVFQRKQSRQQQYNPKETYDSRTGENIRKLTKKQASKDPEVMKQLSDVSLSQRYRQGAVKSIQIRTKPAMKEVLLENTNAGKFGYDPMKGKVVKGDLFKSKTFVDSTQTRMTTKRVRDALKGPSKTTPSSKKFRDPQGGSQGLPNIQKNLRNVDKSGRIIDSKSNTKIVLDTGGRATYVETQKAMQQTVKNLNVKPPKRVAQPTPQGQTSDQRLILQTNKQPTTSFNSEKIFTPIQAEKTASTQLRGGFRAGQKEKLFAKLRAQQKAQQAKAKAMSQPKVAVQQPVSMSKPVSTPKKSDLLLVPKSKFEAASVVASKPASQTISDGRIKSLFTPASREATQPRIEQASFIKIDQAIRPSVDTRQAQTSASATVQSVDDITVPIVDSPTSPVSRTRSRSGGRFSPPSPPSPTPTSFTPPTPPRPISPRIPRVPQRTPRLERPPQPPRFFRFNRETPPDSSSGRFEVFLKPRQGEGFRPSGLVGSNLRDAVAKGSLIVGSTAKASFKVKDSKGNIIPEEELLKLTPGGRFTASKSGSGVLVEKSKFRISSPGEKQEITLKGIQANKIGGRLK